MNKKVYSLIFSLVLVVLPKFIFSQVNWSDASSWPNGKPGLGAHVIIPQGTHMILDENPPNLASLTINGTLEFAEKDLELSCGWILVNGVLRIGSESNPFEHRARIIINATDRNENIMGMGTRGIMVMGSIEINGIAPQTMFTKLNSNTLAGSTQLLSSHNTGWAVGDQIVIAPTDFYNAANGNSVSQLVEINSINQNNISINVGLNANRWGSLQYVTANGLSLTPGNLPIMDTALNGTPLVLDERALITNVSRNISIEAPNDALWQQFGFGVHIMIMGISSSAKINGLQVIRGGQAGIVGRYPIHFHQKSYQSNSFVSDVNGDYLRNSSIVESSQRGIVIHGTNGLEVKRNIVYNVRGHGVFTEDAVERRNNIDSNIVLRVRNPLVNNALKQHEIGGFGSSGFWISNPDNQITNNWAGDCEGIGFWLAFPTRPFGLNAQVNDIDGQLLRPNRIKFGEFKNNIAHSNRMEGIRLDDPEIDEDGNTMPIQYSSTTNGREPQWNSNTRLRFVLEAYQVWKNGTHGIWDRAVWPSNPYVVSADNCGRFFAGSGADGLIEKSLVIGTSLNHLYNGSDRFPFQETLGGNETPVAFATYHSAFDIKNNIVINFPLVDTTRSGAFATEDYYIRPVDKGQVRNINNLLINTHPGVKLGSLYPWYALAGALWDPNGNWSGIKGNLYFVYDDPFFTYGQTPVSAGQNSGGVLVNGPFYGINDFIVNRSNLSYEDLMAIRVKRWNNGLEVGNWEIASAQSTTWLLAHMRHFAAHPSSRYTLDFPEIDTISDLAFSVENMLTENDTFTIGVEYNGAYQINQVYSSSFANFMDSLHAYYPESFVWKHIYKRVSSIDSLDVECYYHDSINNRVWIKIQGGIDMTWNPNEFGEFSDEKLYRLFNIRIFGEKKPYVAPSVSKDNIEELSVKFYPNPANQEINIESDGEIEISLLDIQGKEIDLKINRGRTDISELKSGTYLIKIENRAGVTRIIKFIKY